MRTILSAIIIFSFIHTIDAQYQTYVNPITRQLNKTLPVGTTPGNGSVSSTGAFNYVIPIEVPPGTAGMQPSLAITYSSSMYNGILGIGWRLSGFSAITREGTNLYFEDELDAVDFDSLDRFNLDGNRLIAINGKYGANNTEYRTEFTDFSRIKSFGTAGNGPACFKVETRDGLILEYGYTADARIEAQGKSDVLVWYINKVQDKYGNYCTYNYTENNATGECYPLRITYNFTGSPYNTIVFFYADRSDIQKSFIGGSEINQKKILQKIEIKAEGVKSKEYSFRYNNGLFSRLNEIVEFGSDGKQLNSTVIGWDNDNRVMTGTPLPKPFRRKKNIVDDFNGDGRTDYVSFDSLGFTVFLANANSFDSIFNINTTKPFQVFNGDFNGDGKSELLYMVVEEDVSYCLYKIVNAQVLREGAILHINVEHAPLVADFNGDGISELLIRRNYNPCPIKDLDPSCQSDPNWWLYRFSSSNWILKKIKLELDFGFLVSSHYKFCDEYINDFNGNGKKDIFSISNYGMCAYEIVKDSLRTSVLSDEFVNKRFRHITLGDFNGDGYTDVFSQAPAPDNTFYLSYSTGKNFVHKVVTFDYVMIADTAFYVADVNHDGKSDLLIIGKDDSMQKGVFITFGTGTGFKTGSYFYDNRIIDIVQKENAVGDFNGDGYDELIFNQKNQSSYIFSFSNNNVYPYLVNSIANGLNQITRVKYAPLTLPSVYTKGTGAVYPVQDVLSAFIVADTLYISNGLGSSNIIKYRYSGLKNHLRGKGLLGFMGTVTENISSQLLLTNTYSYQGNFFFPFLSSSLLTTTSGTAMSRRTSAYGVVDFGSKRILPVVTQSVEYDYLSNIKSASDIVYDAEGNTVFINNILSGIEDGAIPEVMSMSEYNWIAGYGAWTKNLLKNKKVTTIRQGDEPYIRTTGFIYNTKWKVTSQVNDSTDSKKVTTTYTYHSTYGVPIRTDVSASGVNTRIQQFSYDPKYRYVTRTTNSLGQFVESSYDAKTGNIIQAKDLNGLITQYYYDGFGSLRRVRRPDNVTVKDTLIWTGAGDISNSLFYSQHTQPGSAANKTYFDLLGRDLRTEIIGFDGSKIYNDKYYNSKGQLEKYSEPYYAGVTPIFTILKYDAYGRNTEVNTPRASYSITQQGRLITKKNLSVTPNQVYSSSFDAAGNVISVSDGGGTINYTYYSSGLPKSIVSPGNVVTSMKYDLFGNQTEISEPNTGIYAYQYNAFSELISQSHNDNSINLSYDVLGRILSMTETEGTTSYTYDVKPNGKGMPALVTSPGSTLDYSYDSFSRTSQVTETIDGVSYPLIYEYDNLSRLNKLTYPSGFSAIYEYNPFGYVNKVKRGDNGAMIWEALSMNERLQFNTYLNGNNRFTVNNYNNLGFLEYQVVDGLQVFSYAWQNATGNLLSRTDLTRNLTETFTYDNLDRLVSSKIGTSTRSYVFNANGNIQSKSDAGTYSYSSAKPFAVTAVSNPNGDIDTVMHNISYTSFDKVKEIKNKLHKEVFIYGADKERCKMQLFENGSLKLTRIYAHGIYEKEITPSGTREINYINTPAGTTAFMEIKGATKNMYYLHGDHQGSITMITDQSGNKVAEMSYDAWGRRRNPNNWTYTGFSLPALTSRGYTGHEHMDEFKLINMNGRMYDPITSRFLSPDILVQNASSTQSYNRYSYCLNNPLKYVDPSGYTYLEDMDIYRYEGGGYWYRGAYYSFDSENGNFHKTGGGGGGPATISGCPYRYDYHTKQYVNNYGNTVSYQEFAAYAYQYSTTDYSLIVSSRYKTYDLTGAPPIVHVWAFVKFNIDNNGPLCYNNFSNSVNNYFSSVYSGKLSGGYTHPSGGGGLWNDPVTRAIVPDFISIGVGFTGIVGTGAGSSIELRWVTRGPEASWKPMVTVTQSVGGGFQVDATLNIEGANYIGNVNNIRRSMMQTSTPNGDFPTIWGAGGLSAGGKIGVTGYITPNVGGSLIIGREINIGAGLPAGPLPINGAGGVSNTWILYDFNH